MDKFSPDASVARDGGALFVGRILPHKGIDQLIRGLPAGMPLTIVGPQPDRETAAALVRLAAGKDVCFKQGLDDEQLVREYRRAVCIVLPSVYRTSTGTETAVPELLGQTLLEGMACEAPAICTNVASLPEIVEDGVTGFVVPPNDPAALGDRLRDSSAAILSAPASMGRQPGRVCSSASRGTAWFCDVSRPTKDGRDARPSVSRRCDP